MALVMEEDKLSNPKNIGFFRAIGEVFQSNRIADLIEAFTGLWIHNLNRFSLSASFGILGRLAEHLFLEYPEFIGL
jgi:hypothetical protein